MKGLALAMAVAALLLALIACRREQPDTPDIEETVEANVSTTRATEGSREATIEVRDATEPATRTRAQTPTPRLCPRLRQL